MFAGLRLGGLIKDDRDVIGGRHIQKTTLPVLSESGGGRQTLYPILILIVIVIVIGLQAAYCN